MLIKIFAVIGAFAIVYVLFNFVIELVKKCKERDEKLTNAIGVIDSHGDDLAEQRLNIAKLKMNLEDVDRKIAALEQLARDYWGSSASKFSPGQISC